MNYLEATTVAGRLWDLMVTAVQASPEDRLTSGPQPRPFGVRAGQDEKPFMQFIPREGRTRSPVTITRAQGVSALRQALIRGATGDEVNTSSLGSQASGSYLLVLWHEVIDDYIDEYGDIPGVTDRPGAAA